MDSLEDLLFYRCNNLTDCGLKKLARLPNLKALDLQECGDLTESVVEVFDSRVQINYQAPRA